jgi:hypothetical protein
MHNDKLHNVYNLPYINRVIESRRIRRAGHVARMGWGEMRTKYGLRNLWVRATRKT